MAAVAAAAKRRSAMIADHGPSIIVRYPSSSALSLEAGSPETVHQRMRFAAFCLGRSRVQVYSARQDGGWPHLHLVSTPLRKGRRHARLVSLPGCRVVPDEKYGLVLYDLADRLVPPRLTSPDDFVYRAFELLAAEAFRATKGHELERVAW